MTFALTELNRLLTPDASLLGVVVHTNGRQLRVATERGAISASALEALSVGERVILKNGIATKAPAPRLTFSI